MDKPTIILDGRLFSDFEGFVTVVNDGFAGKVDWTWNGNLDAFDDLLWQVEGEHRIVWSHAELSCERLGYEAMVEWLTGNLQRCHPDNATSVAERLRRARIGEGPTLFEWLVEIIRSYPQFELMLEGVPA
jgi:hypothetical protein